MATIILTSTHRRPWTVGTLFWPVLVLLVTLHYLSLIPTTLALSPVDHPALWTRGDFLSCSSSSLLLLPNTLLALAPSTTVRNVDVGGGFDLLAPPTSSLQSKPDAFFPISMEGLWTWSRTVVDVQGDAFQAQSVWNALGGSTTATKLAPGLQESYLTRFLRSPYNIDSLTGYTVMDRGFDYAARSGRPADAIAWRAADYNPTSHLQLVGNMNNSNLQLDVVWRIVELPNDQGFGSQELYKITDGPLVRAALVKRRFRRNFDPQQNYRVVEGLEVVKTFRVLDGVAGTEFPTSTVKSQLRLVRPRGDGDADVPSGAY